MMEVGGPERDYAFFDSFARLPPAEVIDGPLAVAAEQYQSRLDVFCKTRVGTLGGENERGIVAVVSSAGSSRTLSVQGRGRWRTRRRDRV